MPNKKITIGEETQIDAPGTREMFVVEKMDWDRVKRMIRNIRASGSKWENAAWIFLTIAITFGIAAFTVPIGNNANYQIYFFIALFFSIVITIILFFVAFLFNKNTKNLKQEVISEMELMEQKIARSEEEPVKSELRILEAIYGTNRKNINITQNLNDLIKDNKLSAIISNKIAGCDPAEMYDKELKIRWRYQGREYEKILKEGDQIDLP